MSVPRDNPAPAQPGGPALQQDEARLAHELANLLDGSLRNVGLVMSSLRGPARADEGVLRRLETANQAMQQMAALIQRWMSRPPEGGLYHEPYSATLRDTIGGVVQLMNPVAASRGIDIVVEIAGEAAGLPSGPIYPVIANALRNSIEAIGPLGPLRCGGRIEIAARLEKPGGVELSIRDDGPGVEPALFRDGGVFIHGITTKHNGHGLGLSLARDIVRGLGGTMVIRNVKPRGAEVVVRFPVV